jgi:hypothetical protein
VGTHQDLTGGHGAKSLLIADSERIARCGPSLIAPADLVRPRLGTARMADHRQIRQFCLRQHDRHRGYERMFELRRG